MAHDFSIVTDLRSQAADVEGSDSPAHFDEDTRREEIRSWNTHRIKTRSYASRVPPDQVGKAPLARAFAGTLRRLAPAFELGARMLPRGPGWWLLPPVALASEAVRAGEIASLPVALRLLGASPSFVFDLFHAACADSRGPFRRPAAIAPTLGVLGSKTVLTSASIAEGDSDGVVNTLSMLWPYDPEAPEAHPIELVDADHGDVIGHFKLRPVVVPDPAPRRPHFSYDFFQTSFTFPEATFSRLWRSVFDFCTGD
jgi:hypothetical protein